MHTDRLIRQPTIKHTDRLMYMHAYAYIYTHTHRAKKKKEIDKQT